MEPVTHILTGACLGRSGLNRKAAYATLTMAVAAEFPDIDTLWSVRGPVESFQHHRGITHTLVGLPVEAGVIVACVWGLHRWRMLRAEDGKLVTAAPVRWAVLYGLAMVALLSHLLLDFTNNYGIRPLFPFDRHWYAGSIVFIFDPAIFLLLVAAVVMPWLLGLVNSEIGARREAFKGRVWARSALVGIVLLWGLRAFEHGRAVGLAMGQSVAAPVVPSASGVDESADVAPADPVPQWLTPQRVLASPSMLSPFHWSAVTDYGQVYQLAEVDTRRGEVVADQEFVSRPPTTREVRAAMGSALGRAYMDWSSMPFVTVRDGFGGEKQVVFQDPRFLGDSLLLHLGDQPPLTGVVTVDAQGRVVEQEMDGKVERQ